MMKNPIIIDEKKVWEDDVKSMSYEDLMAAVRYLDRERTKLAMGLTITQGNNDNTNDANKEDRHKAA